MDTVEPWYVSKEISPTIKVNMEKLNHHCMDRIVLQNFTKWFQLPISYIFPFWNSWEIKIDTWWLPTNGGSNVTQFAIRFVSLVLSVMWDARFLQNTNIFTAQPFARQQDMHPSNVIITKLTRIQDYVLKRFDPELHAHLEKMEIAPQIYGM